MNDENKAITDCGRSRVLRVATQNLLYGGDVPHFQPNRHKLEEFFPYIAALDADVLVLTEFKSGPRGKELCALLASAGYGYLVASEQPAKALGVAIASRLPLEIIESATEAIAEPWRAQAVRVAGVSVLGFYVPLDQSKPLFWDCVLRNAAALRGTDVLLAGDLNTGKYYVDEEGATFKCAEKISDLEALGYEDCWRAANPHERGATWFSNGRNGFRLDYIWRSPSLSGRVISVRHDHAALGAGATDHAAVIVDIRKLTH